MVKSRYSSRSDSFSNDKPVRHFKHFTMADAESPVLMGRQQIFRIKMPITSSEMLTRISHILYNHKVFASVCM